jgi:hypothetical protein
MFTRPDSGPATGLSFMFFIPLRSSTSVDMSVRWRRPGVPDAPVRRALNLRVACVVSVLFPRDSRETVRPFGWELFHLSITPKGTAINPPTGSLHRCICITGGCGQCQPSALDASWPQRLSSGRLAKVGQVHLAECLVGLAASEQVKRRDGPALMGVRPRNGDEVTNLRRAGCGARRRCARPGAQEMPWPRR